MRLASSNFRLFPVYNVLKDQHRFICGDPCSETIRVYDSAYPPFQLISRIDLGDPDFVLIRPVCNDNSLFPNNVTATAIKVLKDIDNDGINEFVYTFGGGEFDGIPEGTYYVEVQFPDSLTYYTEVYYHPGTCVDCGEYWYLEYSHSCDEKSLGDYSTNFLNKLFLGDTVLQRDGELENTVSRKDGFGVETIIATDVRPKWSMEIMGNIWLLDSLKFLKLYDQIYLKRSANTDAFTITNIEVTSKGDINNDCQFPIKISFTKDVLINTKCCNSVYEQAPVPGNCAGMSVQTSNNFAICAGATVELMATITGGSAPYVYIWSDGQTGQTIEITPTETITMIVTAVDAFGCVKQDSVTITVVACEGPLEVTITPDPVGSVCAGASVDLDASVSGGSGSYTYLWSTGATTQDITVTPSATTVYSLQVTDTISGDITVELITIVVVQIPDVTIIANGCNLSISLIEACNEGSPTYQWQVETSPGVWAAAPGINNGTTYTGINGSKYRLAYTCSGCTGYSNSITVACTVPCVTEITDVSYDSGADELSVTYVTTIGSTPFYTGYIYLYERVDPFDTACGPPYIFVIGVTLTTESDTILIPYIPLHADTCVRITLNINTGECVDVEEFHIMDV